MSTETLVVIVMGVTGAGKTTIGRMLATRMEWPFYDADDFHPPANVSKMARGIALTDADRRPWLEALRAVIARHVAEARPAVVACSTLKASYRHILHGGDDEVRFVYLRGSAEIIARRIAARRGHFAKTDLLASQFAALEEPEDALVVDVSQSPEEIVSFICRALGL